MKRYKTPTVYFMCLTLMLSGLVFSGCGESKKGGGGTPSTTTPVWYHDYDEDGFGNPDKILTQTEQPEGYVDNAFDCDDESPRINPMIDELPEDGIDNNCNGETDENPKAGIIPDTGQTLSYTDTFGEDSDYLINFPSYTKLDENGEDLPSNATSWKMIRDEVTGLVWAMKEAADGVQDFQNPHDADNTYTFEEATNVFVSALNTENFGNGNTWRMPTIKELTYLANSSKIVPCITTAYFPYVKSTDQIWSGTDSAGEESKSWLFNLTYNAPSLITKTKKHLVWAVRGANSESDYVEYGSAIIVDKKTGLMWQKTTALGDNSKGLTFEKALSYCEDLELNGYSDWRLPSRNELLSLARFDLESPSIDPLFSEDVEDGGYWSSTTYDISVSTGLAWFVNFSELALEYSDKTELRFVRAVRGGKLSNPKTWYRDGDGDGYGDANITKTVNITVTKPDGYVGNNTDCNDSDSGINPGVSEIVDDSIDQDCSGAPMLTWYQDSDNDGFGAITTAVRSEVKPSGYIHKSDDITAGRFDCNDKSFAINPGAVELADDGFDNDCNGSQSLSWYQDNDNDTYGNNLIVYVSETKPNDSTYVNRGQDCDDGNSAVNPGKTEVLDDGLDNNCNGFQSASKWYKDNDGDGYGGSSSVSSTGADTLIAAGYVYNSLDCNDSMALVNPSASDILDDGIDNNCNGFQNVSVWYEDKDGDGYGSDVEVTATNSDEAIPAGYAIRKQDCDDANSAINPGKLEIADDGIDNDCSGYPSYTWYRDSDGDGYGNPLIAVESESDLTGAGYSRNNLDLEDGNDQVNPSMPEIPDDGLDNDCNGLQSVSWYQDSDADGFGDAGSVQASEIQPAGYVINGQDCDDANNAVNPGKLEIADDGIDNDCNGSQSYTWYRDSDGDGYGNPLIAVESESDLTGAGYSRNNLDLEDGNDQVNPSMPEIPDDGLDNDCNGLQSVSWYQDSDADGFGDAGSVLASEIQPVGYEDNAFDCDDTKSNINPMAVDIADGIDNNCNGDTDELPIIPDTGQLNSYTNTYGEDSDYLINPPSYTKLDENGNALPASALSWKMVKDEVTGLIWVLKNSSDGVENASNIHDADNTYTVDEAKADYVDALNTSSYGNSSEWRLPTIRELAYLANSSNTSPCITTTYFPQVKATDKIWSSTPKASDTSKNWYYSLPNLTSISGDLTEKHCAWAVRGEAKTSQFKRYVPGIINDIKTGLMWQETTAPGSGMTFNDALNYCENLNLGGYTDWRLPNKNELMSLVRFDMSAPAADPVFTDTKAGMYWTSTTYYATVINYGWAVNFYAADITVFGKSTVGWVRAVRGGQKPMAKKWYRDKDGDGYGDDAVQKIIDATEPQPTGYVAGNTDCNDDVITIHPLATEVPDDGIDQNCTGVDAFTWYKDSDEDGFGDPAVYLVAEVKPASYIKTNSSDCDDANKSIHPGMMELLDDGIDNDCNGIQRISVYTDADGDGVGAGLSVIMEVSDWKNPPDGFSFTDKDCNDGDNTVYPGLAEVFGDLLDSNCNNENDDESLQIIPDTGQVSSYTGTPGEDGDYLINKPSYTKIAVDGSLLPADAVEWFAVRDNITGLYWEVKTVTNAGDEYTYSDAVNYSETLDLAGFDDWRVPTLTELATIAHLDLSNPAIDSAFFPRIASERYWTITKLNGNTNAYTVSFRYGESYNESMADHFRVISVRGDVQSLAARLLSNGDGTVTDTETGLMWNNLLTSNGTWSNAVTHWESSESAGYNDWRLPTESDIATILDILEQDSTFDFGAVFTNLTLTGSFWTTVLAEDDPGKALVFSLITGQITEMDIQANSSGLAVRGVIQKRFIVNKDGTVFDSKTGLQWIRVNANNGLLMTFENALAFSNTLTFAGYQDWRVPNRNEMISLLDAFMDDSQSYSTVFPDSEAIYWTSSTCPGMSDSNYGWQIDFHQGSEALTIGHYSNSNVFRAVRGGNPE